MEARGLRNSNPGNIRKSKDKWQGLSDKQPDPFFFTFEEPVWGIRAMIKTFWTYHDKYDLKSVDQLIRRWAPPTENNTTSYVNAVAKEVGVSPECPLDLRRQSLCIAFIKAVIRHENGKQPYPDEVLQKAFNLAESQ